MAGCRMQPAKTLALHSSPHLLADNNYHAYALMKAYHTKFSCPSLCTKRLLGMVH